MTGGEPRADGSAAQMNTRGQETAGYQPASAWSGPRPTPPKTPGSPQPKEKPTSK